MLPVPRFGLQDTADPPETSLTARASLVDHRIAPETERSVHSLEFDCKDAAGEPVLADLELV